MDIKRKEIHRKHLSSLTTHLRKYEKPSTDGYDAFATSYISGDIPWKKILYDEVDISSVEPVPFSPKFENEKFALQEKEKELCGESVRKKYLLPSSHDIFCHFKDAEITDRNEHLGYLYFKAMQYSNLNKALALDELYPKPDSNVLRSTFSKVHQKVVAEIHREKKKAAADSAEATFEESEEKLFTIPQIDLIADGSRRMAIAGETDDLNVLRQVIKDAMDKPTAFKDFQMHTEPWQFKAKADRARASVSKKRKFAWKKNIYPPKSVEERIAELRSMAPPLQPEHLETDQLPGIWEPELMVDTFKTAYAEAQDDDCKAAVETDWWKTFNVNKKCLKWLQSIPDTL